MGIFDGFKKMWDAFHQGPEPTFRGPSYSQIPARTYGPTTFNDRSTLAAVYSRIALDVASVVIKHIQVDDQGRFVRELDTGLNYALNFEPNVDQTPVNFKKDLALTLFDNGSAAIVPTKAIIDTLTGTFSDISVLRVGKILEYYPEHVRVSVFNHTRGFREEVTISKKHCCVVSNPFFTVMNEPNSTANRLRAKLALLDNADAQSSSGKLDLIIQLPYIVKSDARKAQAESRRASIEDQLTGSKYGIAYTDGTERITQLNRPVENNLQSQINDILAKLYSELGMTPEILNGTANESTMINYFDRIVYPVVEEVVQAMQRTFVGREGLQNKQSMFYVRTSMQLLTMETLASLSDALCRNEIASANEIRSWIGLQPSSEPNADKLINSNMPQPTVKQ